MERGFCIRRPIKSSLNSQVLLYQTDPNSYPLPVLFFHRHSLGQAEPYDTKSRKNILTLPVFITVVGELPHFLMFSNYAALSDCAGKLLTPSDLPVSWSFCWLNWRVGGSLGSKK